MGDLCYDFSKMETFLNQENVRKALGVGDVKFVSCSTTVYDGMLEDWMVNLAVKIPALVEDGINVLVYAGEYDLLCNWLGKIDHILLPRYVACYVYKFDSGLGINREPNKRSWVQFHLHIFGLLRFEYTLAERLIDVIYMVYAGNSRWVEQMNWSGQKDFGAAKTVPFLVDGKEAGLMKNHGPLTFLKVNRIMPMNQTYY